MLLNYEQNALLLNVGFTQRQISELRQKFYNLFQLVDIKEIGPAPNNTSNVTKLPPSSHYTVEQVLTKVLEDSKEGLVKDVMIIGWSDEEQFIVRSSYMTRRDALWLLEQGKIHTLNLETKVHEN